MAAVIVWAGAASAALAHPFSVSYAHVAVEERRVAATVRLPLDDMDLLLRLDRDLDGTVSDQEITAAAPALEKYLAERVTVQADGVARRPALERTGRWADSSGFPFVEVVASYPVDRLPATLSLRVGVLADLYADHRTVAEIVWGEQREPFVFQHGNTFEMSSLLADGWQAARTFLVLGIEHILTGYDHLLFLLALLVAGRGARELVVIVTSFTVAHSLTLAAAALGAIALPAALVEAAIALSIMYVGIDNLLRRDVSHRWKLTFALGLLHGFGFANVLRDLELPRQSLVSSLFTFNLGVEVGQLAVVVLLWPVLRAVQRSAYAQIMTRSVSVIVTVCGLVWFVQRVS